MKTTSIALVAAAGDCYSLCRLESTAARRDLPACRDAEKDVILAPFRLCGSSDGVRGRG